MNGDGMNHCEEGKKEDVQRKERRKMQNWGSGRWRKRGANIPDLARLESGYHAGIAVPLLDSRCAEWVSSRHSPQFCIGFSVRRGVEEGYQGMLSHHRE